MERNILKKRIKGLLAFMLVFMMMFGSSLTVLAQEWYGSELTVSTTVEGGDIIYVSGGWVMNDSVVFTKENGSVTLPEGKWKVVAKSGDDNAWFITLELEPELVPPSDNQPVTPEGPDDQPAAPEGSDDQHVAYKCDHNYRWVVGLKPTEEKDGRADYECEWCGSVTASQPITFFYVIIQNIITDIEEAPANGVVTVDNKYLRCLTDEIIEALQKRPDVTLDVKFTDQEVPLHFTIPAGMAPADGSDWYGYYYLGTVYGWIWE